MECIRNQADYKIMLRDLFIECLVVRDIERDGMSILYTFREFLGTFKCSAG
jgi:hypothetical protein